MTNDEMYDWHQAILLKLRNNEPLTLDEHFHVAFCFGAVWMHHWQLEEKENEGGR